MVFELSRSIAQGPDIETDEARHDLSLKRAMGQIDGEIFMRTMTAPGCSSTLEALR